MGTNNPNLPSNVLSDEEAIQYLAAIVQAMRTGLYTAFTSNNPTLTAAQMVGGAIEVSGQTAAQTLTTDTAANIIARMQALDANAAIGSTAQMSVVNDNTSSGAVTVTAGSGVTMVTPNPAVAINSAARYQIKWTGAGAVSLTKNG
jgi:hypothetical protein